VHGEGAVAIAVDAGDFRRTRLCAVIRARRADIKLSGNGGGGADVAVAPGAVVCGNNDEQHTFWCEQTFSNRASSRVKARQLVKNQYPPIIVLWHF
jgi:hypothetical protein